MVSLSDILLCKTQLYNGEGDKEVNYIERNKAMAASEDAINAAYDVEFPKEEE